MAIHTTAQMVSNIMDARTRSKTPAGPSDQSGTVVDMPRDRWSSTANSFSELTFDEQCVLVNLVFEELLAAFPGQYLKYENTIAGWVSHEKNRLKNDPDFGRLTGPQIENGLSVACKGNFLPSLGRLIECCQPSLSDLGLPTAEQAWQEACNHSHEIDKHQWSHNAVFLAGRRVSWYAIRTASGDFEVQRIKKTFTEAYQILVDDTVRGADLTGEAVAVLTDMSRQSAEEKALRYGQFIIQQEMDKQGIPQRMSGAEALKRMRAGL